MSDDHYVAKLLNTRAGALDRRLALSRAVALASQGWVGADEVAAILADDEARQRLGRIWSATPPAPEVLARASTSPAQAELLNELGVEMSTPQPSVERCADDAGDTSADVVSLKPRTANACGITEVTFELEMVASPSQVRTGTAARHNIRVGTPDGRSARIRVTTGRGGSGVDVRLSGETPAGGLWTVDNDVEIVNDHDVRIEAPDQALAKLIQAKLVFGK